MKNKEIDKRIVFLVRVILFIVGAVVGWLAMWQFLTAYPAAVRDPLKIVFEIIAALVAAVALMLSARPIIRLGKLIADGVLKLAARMKPMELVGIVLGIAAGLMVAFLAYALMNLFIPIPALKVVLTVIVAFIACFIASVAFARGLSAPAAEEPAEKRFNGCIVHSSAFESEKLALALEWVDGPVIILGKTIRTLIDNMERNEAALIRYKELSADEAFRQAEGAGGDETEAVVRYALTRRLKIIAKRPDERFGNPLLKVLDVDAL